LIFGLFQAFLALFQSAFLDRGDFDAGDEEPVSLLFALRGGQVSFLALAPWKDANDACDSHLCGSEAAEIQGMFAQSGPESAETLHVVVMGFPHAPLKYKTGLRLRNPKKCALTDGRGRGMFTAHLSRVRGGQVEFREDVRNFDRN
jgi:hypothetical protein